MPVDDQRELAAVLREMRSEIDGLWGALRRGGGGGGGGGGQGPPGTPAGFGTPSASASGLAAGQNPTASVTATGPDTAKIFSFAFGIPAGAQGPPGSGGGGGNLERIQRNVLPSNTVATSFQNIPQTYSHLQVKARISAAAGGDVTFRINQDATNNYQYGQIYTYGVNIGYGATGGAGNLGYIAQLATHATNRSSFNIEIPFYREMSGVGRELDCHMYLTTGHNVGATAMWRHAFWGGSAAITRLDFYFNACSAGTVWELYGIV